MTSHQRKIGTRSDHPLSSVRSSSDCDFVTSKLPERQRILVPQLSRREVLKCLGIWSLVAKVVMNAILKFR